MKFLGVLALGVVLVACQEGGVGGGSGVANVKSPVDSTSYAIGLSIGERLKSDSVVMRGVSVDLMAAGIRDAANGKPGFDSATISRVMMSFQARATATMDSVQKATAEAGKKEGDAFLATNKAKQGVTTLPSGVQYQVVKSGAGESPTRDDTVVVHYKGTLLNGTVFDESYKRGEPATFAVTDVIPGWTEVLQKMKVGDKWMVWIPADQAYGAMGQPPSIPANATLTFEVELISVKKGKPGSGRPAAPPADASQQIQIQPGGGQ